MLVFEENVEKTSQCRVENQWTQPTHDTESRNRTQATLVGGECTHHCAIPAPRWVGLFRRYWLSFVSVWYTCTCTLSFGQAQGFKVCNVYHLNSMESFSIKCWNFNNCSFVRPLLTVNRPKPWPTGYFKMCFVIYSLTFYFHSPRHLTVYMFFFLGRKRRKACPPLYILLNCPSS